MSEFWREHLKPHEATRLAEIDALQTEAKASIAERRKIVDRARKRAGKARPDADA